MSISLETNLAELPLPLFQQLASSLASNEVWLKIVDGDKKDCFYSSNEEIERINRQASPSEAILRLWGNRGQTVQSLMKRLQIMSVLHGSSIYDRPQLVLHRKFKPIRWASAERPIRITVSTETQEIFLEPLAVGFPSACFEWRKDGEPLQIENGCTLRLTMCKCETTPSYTCRVWNCVEDGQSFSDFYRFNSKGEPKEYESSLTCEPINLIPYVKSEHACDRCKAQELEKLREIMGNNREKEDIVHHAQALAIEELRAADKVALILSNCTYRFLPELRTPHCDAETLAAALQEMDYKTVVLADLTLSEMQFMIKEYKKLLGNDVYAVLYFAGHGFEVNGQCYLLPVDAPLEAHAPEHSISMDWVLATFADYSPALHLVLLDVCRKYIPADCVPPFNAVAEKYKKKHKANRNTVYGYSTSGGVGAYEVKGEDNGVFMKYLKNHLLSRRPVVEMLQHVFIDIEKDARVQKVQIPELRTSLTRPRSLADPIDYNGHTISFSTHNGHWTSIHELPTPVYVRFDEQGLLVTIWFSFCGHFTNKVYVFSSVSCLLEDSDGEENEEQKKHASTYLAYLRFGGELESAKTRMLTDEEEGVSVRTILNHLQRSTGPIECEVDLCEKKKVKKVNKVIATKTALLGHVLITKLYEPLRRM